MKLVINKAALESNIQQASLLTSCQNISLMMKSFYDYLSKEAGLNMINCNMFGNTKKLCVGNTINYVINEESEGYEGSYITNMEALSRCKTDIVYIPVNFHDDREGINSDYITLARKASMDKSVYLSITSGCINDRGPTMLELENFCSYIQKTYGFIQGISLGGSYYLQFRKLPEFVYEIRIGEYMLFGTIPYCDTPELNGFNALEVELEVVETYRERQHILVRGGYANLDAKYCYLLSGGALEYVDSSSEYTIYKDRFSIYKTGSKIRLIPNYKSLVKLQYVEREYK
ncbi:MAG: hypothetical protein A2X18_07615 [Bacteroidetes bacterium GWF2_40_14]|nr:MAG: hypothetical protein A2X18_07615 [Bacteroidetes bacterium GWF2_40_14]